MLIPWLNDALTDSLTDFDWQFTTPCKDEQWKHYLATYQLPLASEGHQHFVGTLSFPCCQKLVVQAWQPEQPQATALIIHGLYDHVGLYPHLIRYCLQKGWRVVAFDLPGHGLSSGKRASIDSFQQYDDIVSNLATAIQTSAQQPLHLFGQSTGAAIIINHLLKHQIQPESSPFASVNLIAPLVRPREWWKIRCFYGLLKLCKSSLKRERSINSQDQAFLDFLWYQDPLQARQISINWLGAWLAWDKFIHAQASSSLPINIVQGDSDYSVLWRYNLQFLQQRFVNHHTHIIHSGRHHLVNEIPSVRQQVWEFFDQQLEKV